MGTIIRTASWFGIDAIILSGDSVDPYNPKVIRSSAGGIFKIPVLGDVTLLEFIDTSRNTGFEILATLPKNGKSVHELKFPEKSIILFGSEADGLSDPLISAADTLITIPAKISAESLNLAISCGIILGLMDNMQQ